MGAELDKEGGGLMRRKWNDRRGETLVEVLASILIGFLSVTLLFSMIMASGRMDQSAEEADRTFVESLNKAESRTPADAALLPPDPKVTVENKDAPTAGKAEPPVVFYGGRGALAYGLT